jgi:hypothetical protein
MDADTVAVLAGIVLIALAWTVLIMGTLFSFLRELFAPRRPPDPPPSRRLPRRRRPARAVQSAPDATAHPLSSFSLEGK